MSQGKSRKISNRLIIAECLLLAPAVLLDMLAKRWNRKGIPIVQADFLSMDLVKKPEGSIRHCNILNKEQKSRIERQINRHIIELRKQIKHLDLFNEKSIHFINDIKDIETEYALLLPMTKHIVESMIICGTNALHYAAQSEGGTLRLSRMILKAHLILLKFSPKLLDFPANLIHVQGIGILQNDLPSSQESTGK